jgi:hypothetical protein
MVPIFIGAVLFVNWHRKREQRIVAEALPDLVGQRAVAAVEVSRLASLPGRRAWRTEIRGRFGRPAAHAIAGYQSAVSELAFLRHAMRCGTAGPDANRSGGEAGRRGGGPARRRGPAGRPATVVRRRTAAAHRYR